MTGNSVSFAHPAIAQAKIVLAGPPGALFHRITDSVRSLQESEPISVDELIRQEVVRGSSNGVALAKTLASAQSVPNDQVLEIARRWYWSRKRGEGFVVTDFPANKSQAAVFDEWLETRDETITDCLVIRQSESDALREAQQCYRCPVDGRRFYGREDEDLQIGLCDNCGSELQSMADEARAEIRSWFALKTAGTQSLTNHYRNLGLLTELSADEFSPASSVKPAEFLESLIACE